MRHVRAFLFVGIMCFLLSSAIICKGLDKIGSLPDSFKNDEYSYLEGRARETFPSLSFSSFEDGVFQSKFETYLSDLVPGRDQVLLASKGLQRSFIVASSKLLGVKTWPTFYGSDYAYSEASDSIAQIPTKKNVVAARLKQNLKLLSNLIKANSQRKFYMLLANAPNISAMSPVHGKVAKGADYSFYENAIKKELGDDIVFISDPSLYSRDYYSSYYRSDHHWNMDGCYEGYLAICSAMGLNNPAEKSGRLELGAPMYGSYARRGANLPNNPDTFFDYEFQLPPFTVIEPTVIGDSALLARTRAMIENPPEAASDDFFDRYGECYPYRSGLTIIENEQAPTNSSLLIVGDSYARPIDRLLAMHYRTTLLYDPRLDNDETIAETIQSHNISNVLLLLSCEMLYSDDLEKELKL